LSRRTTVEIGDLDRKDRPLRPETLLAGLPRLVRVADETRWRGQSSVATAAVVTAFWALTWLLGQPMRPGASALAAAIVAVPTLLVSSLATNRRIRESLLRAVPPPRATLYETVAASRDRRIKLSGIVLTGIVALLLFDRFSGGGGVMAGLVAGLLAALGAMDWLESRQWTAAERERESRIFAMIRPDALSPRLGAIDVYEIPRPGRDSDLRREPSPFDLEI
jgi:hypothetical protein